MSEIKETDLAWAAGLFDGEGCVQIKRDYNDKVNRRWTTYSLRAIVVNTHVPTLVRFKAIVGIGTIRPMAFYGAHSKKSKQRWEWQAVSKQAEMVLRALLPYLVTKKAQAEIALLSREYQGKIGSYRNLNKDKIEDLRVQLSELNQGRIIH